MTKIYKNVSKGFDFSGLRFICQEHGFQEETKTIITKHDIFGGAMCFAHQCKICGKICKEEVSTEYDEVDL